MENSWQNKCSLGWQSPPSRVASFSRVLLPQESPIQMEPNIGHHFYPYVAQEPKSAACGMVQESLYPNTSNLAPSTSPSALGNSFLALLSGPPTLLPCDLQKLPSPKQLETSGQFHIDGSNVMVSAAGSGVQMGPTGEFSGNVGNLPRNGSDRLPVVSSRAVASRIKGSGSVLPDDLQAVNLNLHSLDLAKEVTHHIFPGTENVNDFSSPRGGLPACTSISNIGKDQNILDSQKISSDVNSVVFNESAALTSGYPRVFCLGTSGELLLSNIGLLSVVCLCHHFHLSVAGFCKHSGFFDVNPGDAVYVDSGETIARWRKVCFHKYRIRVPEDHCGWDWPEGFSATAGLVKHNTPISNVSRSSNLLQVLGSLGMVVRPGQHWNDASPRDYWTDQKLVNDVSADERLKESQGTSSNFPLKDLIETSQENLRAVADSQLMEFSMPRCSTMSTLIGCGGQNSVCHKISAYGDLMSKSVNSFISSQALHNLRTSVKEFDTRQLNNSKEKTTADRDAAPSNVELRLGQPHQLPQTLGNSVLSVSRPQLLNTLGDSQNLLLQGHQISATPKFTNYRQYLQYPAASPNSCTRTEHNQFSFMNNSFGFDDAIDGTKLRQLNGGAAKSSVISNIPSGGNEHCKASNDVVSGSDKPMLRMLHREANTTKWDPIKFSRDRGDGTERLMNINGPRLCNHICRDRKVECVADGSCLASVPNIGFHKHMHDLSSFHGSVSLNGIQNCSAACDKINYSLQLSGVPLNASHSIAIPNTTPDLSNKDSHGLSSCVLDENLRLRALSNVMELHKQEHTGACLGMNQERRNLSSFSDVKIRGAFVDLSTPEDHSHGPICTKSHTVSEDAATSLQFGVTCQMDEKIKKSALFAGLSNQYDTSNCMRGMSLQRKEVKVQCQLAHNTSNVQPSFRFGGSGNISLSSENDTCCQRVPYSCLQNRCCCTIHAELNNCESKGNTYFNALKNGVSGSCKTCTLASNSHKDHMLSTYFGLSGKSKIQIPKKIACLASHWCDVPSKVSNLSNSPSADFLDKRGIVADQPADTASRWSTEEANSLKEKEMSNISSGSSAPAVTQVSIEVNNVGSCIINAGDTRYANHHVVDEESEIGKCWSSDDALDRGRKAVSDKSSCGIMDKLKLRDPFRMTEVQNQVHHAEKTERNCKTGKRKGVFKSKRLDASVCASDFSPPYKDSPKCNGSTKWSHHSSREFQVPLQSHRGTSHAFSANSIRPSSKRRRSELSTAERLYDDSEGEDDCQTEKVEGITDFLEIPEVRGGKKSSQDVTSYITIEQPKMHEQRCADADRSSKFNAVNFMKESSSRLVSIGNGKAKPVVCGDFGVISNGEVTFNVSKSAKIVSLSRILKSAKRCTLAKIEEPKLSSVKELRKVNFNGDGCFNGNFHWKKQRDSATCNAIVSNEVDPDIVMEERENACLSVDEPILSDKERDVGIKKCSSILDSYFNTQLKPKGKEIRKRSLHELTIEGMNSGSPKVSSAMNSKSAPKSRCGPPKFIEHSLDDKYYTGELYKVDVQKSIKEYQRESLILDSDAFCCVCRSSNKDEFNCLLECSQCLIRVHQACYGVSKVPRSLWYCRPCKTSARDVVCVLCGYGGGAMTQALQSSIIIKSLLKAWNVLPESRLKNTSPEVWKDKLCMFSRFGAEGDSTYVLKPLKTEPPSTSVWKFGLQKKLELSCCKVHNSITAGLLDLTVKQWVHMVCGLWTPGTRCPNVDTMNAFDVSGALPPRVNVVCSLCNRPGGSCIKCRFPNCSVRFHPWCAHQKGLLQSEVEGLDNESVGFYGRCLLHATYSQSCGDFIDTKISRVEEKESTCARTEGYKGRTWESFQSNHSGRCLVPPEQLNAWLHINGRKSCARELFKLPITDVEYDCRKEYARYKLAKGWKNLVVYKSGIHALGLYTSQFISRGAMVVEYVGEIVGLHVADKRESEYQSGKKLQYKSACYFFRIDKEHIIDATCKGGIARFVNHSCMPNCVAKVLSMKNGKKVVFFAERDIYPGEEITYDYHFNREDEGEKIPCLCNSKKCKRYLN